MTEMRRYMTQEEFTNAVNAILSSGLTKVELANRLEVSESIIDRYSQGKTAPMQIVRQVTLEYLDELRPL